LRGIVFGAAILATVGMYLPPVVAFTIQCNGTTNKFTDFCSSAAVHVKVGAYSQLLGLLTVHCGGSRDSLRSIFSSGAAYAIVGTMSPLATLRTPPVAQNISSVPHARR